MQRPKPVLDLESWRSFLPGRGCPCRRPPWWCPASSRWCPEAGPISPRRSHQVEPPGLPRSPRAWGTLFTSRNCQKPSHQKTITSKTVTSKIVKSKIVTSETIRNQYNQTNTAAAKNIMLKTFTSKIIMTKNNFFAIMWKTIF